MTTCSVGIRAFRYAVLAVPLLLWAATAPAQDTSGTAPPQPGYGWGMMGPGMVDSSGYGMGWGMMGGGYGYGPGMMGGYGIGPGMMGGGYGMGPGRHGYGALNALDLSNEQRTKIDKIFDAERKQHWSVMGKIMDEENKLRDLYAQEMPDPKKVGAVYGEIGKLHQQMIETHVEASNQMQQVLTKEQREQLRQLNRSGWGPRGPAGRPGAVGPGMMR